MKKACWRWLVVLTLIFLLGESFSVAAKTLSGRVTLIIGKARLYTGKNRSPEFIKTSLKNYRLWSNLRVRQKLRPGDIISVPAKSRLDLAFPNEKLRLDGPTLFLVRTLSETKETRKVFFFFKKQQTKKVSRFKLYFGRLMAKVNKLRRTDVHSLETPTAVMGVYGTAYLARSTPRGKGDLTVVSGEMRVTLNQQPQREYSIFSGNQMRIFDTPDKPVEIKPIPPNVQQKLVKIIEQIQAEPPPGPPVKEGAKAVEEEATKEEEVIPETEEVIFEEFTPIEDEGFFDDFLPGEPSEDSEGDQGRSHTPDAGEGDPDSPSGIGKETGDFTGTPTKEIFFHSADELNYFGGGAGTGHGVDEGQEPAPAQEAPKVDVKIRLDWSNIGK